MPDSDDLFHITARLTHFKEAGDPNTSQLSQYGQFLKEWIDRLALPLNPDTLKGIQGRIPS